MPGGRVIWIGAAFVALACTPPEMSRSELLRHQQELEGHVSFLVRNMNNAKIDSVLSLYEPGPAVRVIWPDGAVARGYDAAEQALRDFYRSISYMNFVLQDPTTEVLAPGVALTTFGHSTDIVGADRNRRPVMAGRGVIVWVRHEGSGDQWKIHLLQLGANARN
jgi:hypothetical protein